MNKYYLTLLMSFIVSFAYSSDGYRQFKEGYNILDGSDERHLRSSCGACDENDEWSQKRTIYKKQLKKYYDQRNKTSKELLRKTCKLDTQIKFDNNYLNDYNENEKNALKKKVSILTFRLKCLDKQLHAYKDWVSKEVCFLEMHDRFFVTSGRKKLTNFSNKQLIRMNFCLKGDNPSLRRYNQPALDQKSVEMPPYKRPRNMVKTSEVK